MRDGSWRQHDLRCALVLLPLVLVACGGGGGGGSGSFDAQGQLLEITFPDPNDVNPGPRTLPPSAAPLDQQVVFEFSGAPDPSQVGPSTLPIRDARGFPVAGAYEVNGNRVVFTPTLPTGSFAGLSAPTVAGLQPGGLYSIRVSPSTWSFVQSVAASLVLASPDPVDPRGTVIGFRTTSDADGFYRGLPARRPTLLGVTPADGAVGVSPQLYTDPNARFAARGPFQLTFDGPLYPGAQELDAFQLIDLDDPGFPAGLPLGFDATVVVNERTRCVVELQASGILPLGHQLSLEYPLELRGLTQDATTVTGHRIASSFTVQDTTAAVVRDSLIDDFDQGTSEGDEEDRGEGVAEADWNVLGSGVLLASESFSGNGELGRFAPPAPPDPNSPRILILDTNNQQFPLSDGSTPEAPSGYTVTGGQFNFTDIDIPHGVIIRTQGVHPLHLTATGSVRIAGSIELDGRKGTSDYSFDSGVAPMPGGLGGSGGGRGGDSHPILYWPPGQVSIRNMVSPPAGATGHGPLGFGIIGGRGGESGTLDKKPYASDQEISCQEGVGNDNGDQGAGGSGGSFLTLGSLGRVGTGNVRPDGSGGWLVTVKKGNGPTWKDLNPGAPGQSPFADADPDNDFIGAGGELPDLVGGQGGGGGGSRAEGYYCGRWCKKDEDPANDALCKGGEYGRKFGDNIGDARGGGGGGGGGAVRIDALGPIDVESTGVLSATGGKGGGGEKIGGSALGGPGGGGSGGAIVLHSASAITVDGGALIDVRGGTARQGPGHGGAGLVQMQVPAGSRATVRTLGSIQPPTAWLDTTNQKIHSEFTPRSAAVSRWFDLGRMTERAPSGTNPRFQFSGLDALGFVPTDGAGNVMNPGGLDIRCDYLGQPDPVRPGQYLPGQEPRANFIPPNATVRVEFQGGSPIAPGSREVDLANVTTWAPSPAIANGLQFVRYRVSFDLVGGGAAFGPSLPRPAVQSVAIRSRF